MPDLLPIWTTRFVEDGSFAAPLHNATCRAVASVARSYPPCWFYGGSKDEHAVQDLADRVFTVCAQVIKARFPFNNRAPFVAYVEECFDGSLIRYHSFFAKLSITREIMHLDYAHNLARDPALRFAAGVYSEVGKALGRVAEPVPGSGRLPSFQLPGRRPGPGLVRDDADVARELRRLGLTDMDAIVTAALSRVPTMTRSRLSDLVVLVLERPAMDADVFALGAPAADAFDPEVRATVRQAVLDAWQRLGPEESALLVMIARGLSYDEVIAARPDFRDRTRLSKAVRTCNAGFVERVAAEIGGEVALVIRPRELAELIYEVLLECIPHLQAREKAS